MPMTRSCEHIRNWAQRAADEPLSEEQRAAIACHVAACPGCAHLPQVQAVLADDGTRQASGRPLPAQPGPRWSRRLGILAMGTAAVVALGLAAHSASQLFRGVGWIPASGSSRIAAQLPVPPQGESPAAEPAPPPRPEPQPVPQAVRAVPGPVIGAASRSGAYLKRIASADATKPSDLKRVSADLLKELGRGGLVRALRVCRRDPSTPEAEALRQVEVVLLRAAAAGDDKSEWPRLKQYVRRLDLIASCDRLASGVIRGQAR